QRRRIIARAREGRTRERLHDRTGVAGQWLDETGRPGGHHRRLGAVRQADHQVGHGVLRTLKLCAGAGVDQRDKHATGLILAFTVDNLEGELARLRAEGVVITMPLTVEEWGERLFQVTDPNGVIVQLMDWAARPGNQPPRATAPAEL